MSTWMWQANGCRRSSCLKIPWNWIARCFPQVHWALTLAFDHVGMLLFVTCVVILVWTVIGCTSTNCDWISILILFVWGSNGSSVGSGEYIIPICKSYRYCQASFSSPSSTSTFPRSQCFIILEYAVASRKSSRKSCNGGTKTSGCIWSFVLTLLLRRRVPAESVIWCVRMHVIHKTYISGKTQGYFCSVCCVSGLCHPWLRHHRDCDGPL